MTPLDEFDDDTTDTVFRDVILLTLVGFVAMVIMLLVSVVFQLVLFGAQYRAFSDVFGVRQEPGPTAGADGQLVA